MTTDNSNRFRVSTKFSLVKVFVYIGLFSILINLITEIINGKFSSKSVAGLLSGTLILLGLLYFIRTRKTIGDDDIQQILYVFTSNEQLEVEIPVERIAKILYSAIFLNRGGSSYTIVYRDNNNQKQEAWLFPIPFNNDIDTIISDTKLKNQDLVTRKWGIGWNEFFD